MRAVIQRVSGASVAVDGDTIAQIEHGLLVLLGIVDADSDEDIRWLSNKIANLRIFADADGVMNLSVKDVKGEIIVVSQFTLHALTKKGNRPSYIKASKPEIANQIYSQFVTALQLESGRNVATGRFGADMQVTLINDGPVTIFIDTKSRE